jgi:hypothetical protein
MPAADHRVFHFFAVSIIPPLIRTNISLIYHRRCTILAVDSSLSLSLSLSLLLLISKLVSCIRDGAGLNFGLVSGYPI